MAFFRPSVVKPPCHTACMQTHPMRPRKFTWDGPGKPRACLKNRKGRLFVQNRRFLCWKSSTGHSLSRGSSLETAWFCLKEPLIKSRLRALHTSCLHLFRHAAHLSLDKRQLACAQSVHPDEKSGGAICALDLISASLKIRRFLYFQASPSPSSIHRTCSHKAGAQVFSVGFVGFCVKFFCQPTGCLQKFALNPAKSSQKPPHSPCENRL